MYDYAGDWVYAVGMPAKSGVGGGIVAVLPGQLGIGVFSPLLDDARQQRPRCSGVPQPVPTPWTSFPHCHKGVAVDHQDHF